jgi:hypothetical protein
MNYEKKYYKFKNKYLNLKKKMLGGQNVEINPVVVKNYNNELDHYEINYTTYKDIVVNNVETKNVNLSIKMTYAPDSQITVSIDEGKNEIDFNIDLKNKSMSNIKIIGIISQESQNVIQECLKKLLKSSYTNQVALESDVLKTQAIIFKFRNDENMNTIYWMAEKL